MYFARGLRINMYTLYLPTIYQSSLSSNIVQGSKFLITASLRSIVEQNFPPRSFCADKNFSAHPKFLPRCSRDDVKYVKYVLIHLCHHVQLLTFFFIRRRLSDNLSVLKCNKSISLPIVQFSCTHIFL